MQLSLLHYFYLLDAICFMQSFQITCSTFFQSDLDSFDSMMVDKLTPAAFEKHSERETSRNWRNNVWVFIGGDKVPLSKTVLLRYYNQALKKSNGSKTIHRDEFVGCSICGKERRFRLRSRGECRVHHDAMAEPNWKCCDYPYDKITCEEEEERGSRKVYRGCTRSPSCKGCTSCVCFGCKLCRFSDCNCQTCLDFTTNTQLI